MEACKPDNEEARLAALYGYNILDTPVEEDFEGITRLIAHICDAPIAVINLIDRDRQFFKSEIGLGVRETPLDISICAHAILQPDVFVVPDTEKDVRFSDNPLVTGDPHLRFYAGALLDTPEGSPLGTLCVLDYQPRELSASQIDALRILSRQVMSQMEMRRLYRREKRIAETLQRAMLIPPQQAALARLDIDAFYESAWDEAAVGGDFFDAFPLSDSEVALVVGDISGKGLVAAEYAARAKFTLRVYLREGCGPAVALSRLNDYLLGDLPADGDAIVPFVALAVAVIDSVSGRATIALAAAEPPFLLRRRNGTMIALEDGGLPLGVQEGSVYTDQCVALDPGDLLLMITDGITEARSAARKFFGPERVERFLRESSPDDALSDINARVFAEARAFTGGRLQDDVCLLLARRRA